MQESVAENSILEMARGAITEQFDIEVTKAIANIMDVNTEAKKKRTVVLTLDLIPTDDRQQVIIKANAKSKLIPNNAIQTSLYVATNSDGEFMASEMLPNLPGQMKMSGEEEEQPKILKLVSGGNL